MKDPLNIIICGVGGQGNVLASRLVAEAADSEGYFVKIGETFGASQRGGAVESHIRISTRMEYGPLIPEGMADIIVALEPAEAMRVAVRYANPNTIVIVNPRPVYPIGVLSGRMNYPPVKDILKRLEEFVGSLFVVDAFGLAEEVGEVLSQNIVMIGALSTLDIVPIAFESYENVIRQLFDEKRVRLNLDAFHCGADVKCGGL
ncbi:MAG: Indolepyruvate oxidoreductase subunit IorB [Candidatus Syntrophoarchaeum sp. GoM_oil]|nr:MAG: Indolepyruvate oxidoreductase subunit IorB [Candidatus Syntrophoarchaeum sp. GoM_oil]